MINMLFHILCLLSTPVCAQPVNMQITLQPVTVAPTDTFSVPVTIQTDRDISGVAFSIDYDATKIQFVGIDQVAKPFSVFQTLNDGHLNCVFLNAETPESLPQETNLLAKIKFVATPDALPHVSTLVGRNLSVTSGQENPINLVGDIFDGEIVVTEQVLKPEFKEWKNTDRFVLALDLHNTQPISALEMVVKLPFPSFLVQQVTTSDRTATWRVFHKHQADSTLSVILTDFDFSHPIGGGDGRILDFEVGDESKYGDLGDVVIDRLLVTDTLGKVVPVAAQGLFLTLPNRFETGGPDSKGNDETPDLARQDTVVVAGGKVDTLAADPDSVTGESEPVVESQDDPRWETNSSVRIVEILADPPAGLAGDANGDGVRESRSDEFVELLNTGPVTVDISGWYLGDDDVDMLAMFRFKENCELAPGERVTVFGGGTPKGVPGLVFADDGSIGNGFTNGGDTVILLNALGDTVDVVIFGSEGGQNQSINRVNNHFVLHSEQDGRDLFSPNRHRAVVDLTFPLPRNRDVFVGDRANMVGFVLFTDKREAQIDPDEFYWVSSDETIVSILPNGVFEAKRSGAVDVWFAWRGRESLHAQITVHPTEMAPPVEQVPLLEGVEITEIHANPGSGEIGDTNGDGTRHSFEDEFIEITNKGTAKVDLSGAYLGDGSQPSTLFQFPNDICLLPGEYLTLFGGGRPQGLSGKIVTDDGRIGDGLSNGGDIVRLISADGVHIVSEVTFGKSVPGVSFQVSPNGLVRLHDDLPGKGRHSPGQTQSLLQALVAQSDTQVIGVGKKIPLRVIGIFDDGETMAFSHEVQWLEVLSGVPLDGSYFLSNSIGEFQLKAQVGSIESNSFVLSVVNFEDVESGQIDSSSTEEKDLHRSRLVEKILHGLVLQEIHANPSVNVLGDTNGNGINEPFGDEFLEFQNISADTLDLSGWRIGDDDVKESRFFEFPPGTFVLPLGFVVLWGLHETPHGGQFSAGGRIGDGLANAGDKIVLLSPWKDEEITTWQYMGSENGVSLVWDSNAGWKRHNIPPRLGNTSGGKATVVVDSLATLIQETKLRVGQTTSLKVLGFAQEIFQIQLQNNVVWHISSQAVDIQGDVLAGVSEGKAVLRPNWGGIWGNALEVYVLPLEEVQTPEDKATEAVVSDEISDNIAPVFLNSPDSLAMCKLRYEFLPEFFDANGDTVVFWVEEGPNWLNIEDGKLSGLPSVEGDEAEWVVLGITDGQDTTLKKTPLRVLALDQIRRHFASRNVYAGLEYAVPLRLTDKHELQLNGEWQWGWNREMLVMRAQSTGDISMGISVSKDENRVVEEWTFEVRQTPKFELAGLVLNPVQSAHQQANPYDGQGLFIQNKGTKTIDMSGWWVGELGNKLINVPKGVVLLPMQTLQVLDEANLTDIPNGISIRGKIGNGLKPGDRVVLLSPNRRDTLVNEPIPDLPNGKILVHRDGRWSADPLFKDLKALVVNSLDPLSEPGGDGAAGLVLVHDKVLYPIYPRPNPFHNYTELGFYSLGGWVGVTVYSVLGQPVRRLVYEHLPQGYYSHIWDGTDDAGHFISAGVYLIHFQTANSAYTHRVAHIK